MRKDLVPRYCIMCNRLFQDNGLLCSEECREEFKRDKSKAIVEKESRGNKRWS